jgi:hypothetical protein
MKALISPQELVYKYDGTLIGGRIAQVDETGFDIAEPLFWVDCSIEVVPDLWYYDTETQTCQLVPVKPINS